MPQQKNRRQVLQILLAAAAACFVAPIASVVRAYLKSNRRILNGAKASFPKTELSTASSSAALEIQGEPVIAILQPDHSIRAFTATCTHMGCTVRYLGAQSEFYCHCHHGRFDQDGVNIPGTPPPSPLTELRVDEEPTSFTITLTAKATKHT